VLKLVRDDKLELNTNKLWFLGFTDPWLGEQKVLSILYQYTGTQGLSLLILGEEMGVFYINDSGANKLQFTTTATYIPRPTQSLIWIAAVVYGREEIREPAIYEKLYKMAQTGIPDKATNEFFGRDTWPSFRKTWVVWYRMDEDGAMKSISGREDGDILFPL
jgi:hypothetical protein